MRIGYACLTTGIPNTNMRSCIMKNATEEKLNEIIAHNLSSLKNMLLFNAHNNIRIFRISSDLIPFGSSPVNKLDWQTLFHDEFSELAKIIKANDIRVTMHPGQYTVLNSPNTDVVMRAIDDLIYHVKILNSLQTLKDAKIIVHIGGVYGDKSSALKRFADVYRRLDSSVKGRLIIENDDKSYNIGDVLSTGESLGIPVVYDNLHSEVNPYGDNSHAFWIEKAAKTWQSDDGNQKIHYSQQAEGKNRGSHSETISINEFVEFISSISPLTPDVMLEVKDKNISAVKCSNTLNCDVKRMTADWQRYKYFVLERSERLYKAIENVLADDVIDISSFYSYTEKTFTQKPAKSDSVKTAEYIWNTYFSSAPQKEREKFQKNINSFTSDKISITRIKKQILLAAEKENISELINSYYFYL